LEEEEEEGKDMAEKMKVMVTGASGLLGRAMMRVFDDCDLVGIVLNRTVPSKHEVLKIDLRDSQKVREKVLQFRPDVIVHCAAERRPDNCEKNPDATFSLNVEATENLAKVAQEIDSWILYISTDYVFDGTNPPYSPNAEPNPLSHYGKTKREGEVAVWKNHKCAGVLRIPILYGPIESLEESAVTILAKAVIEKKPIQIDDWQIRYPTHVDDVARACRQLCERKMKHCGLTGIWHFSSEDMCTKYQITLTIGRLFQLPTDHITPVKTQPEGAPRPRDCHLDTTTIRLMGFLSLSNFDHSLKDVLVPWMAST